MWYCPGANHTPHHAPQNYIDKYKGKFDDGYEAYREWVLARMIERGILPAGTDLTPINPLPEGVLPNADSVRRWDALTDIPTSIGRIIDYLEELGQLDNTLIFYCADNGASGEGSPNGSVNENRFFNGYPDTFNHYPTGWAVAFSTPYKMFKRYAS